MNLKFFWPLNIFLGCFLFGGSNWIVKKFGKVTYEQIMFHLNMPFSSERKLVFSFIQNTFFPALIILFSLVILFLYLKGFGKRKNYFYT